MTNHDPTTNKQMFLGLTGSTCLISTETDLSDNYIVFLHKTKMTYAALMTIFKTKAHVNLFPQKVDKKAQIKLHEACKVTKFSKTMTVLMLRCIGLSCRIS